MGQPRAHHGPRRICWGRGSAAGADSGPDFGHASWTHDRRPIDDRTNPWAPRIRRVARTTEAVAGRRDLVHDRPPDRSCPGAWRVASVVVIFSRIHPWDIHVERQGDAPGLRARCWRPGRDFRGTWLDGFRHSAPTASIWHSVDRTD